MAEISERKLQATSKNLMISTLKFRKAEAFWPGTSDTTPSQESNTTKAGKHARTAALADASSHEEISTMAWQ